MFQSKKSEFYLFNFTLYLSVFLCLGIVFSCTKETNTNQTNTNYKYLVYDSLITSVPLAQVQVINTLISLNLGSQPALSNLNNIFKNTAIKNTNSGFKVFNIQYRTTLPDSTPIVASGVFILPDTNLIPVKLAVYNHSTLSSLADAPSNYANFNLASGIGIEVTLMAQVVAPSGYAIACPDYIGYGLTTSLVETYAQSHLGKISADMLLAFKEFLSKRNYKTSSDSVSIYGYSEGGMASMATHQQLELRNQQPVRFSFCGSGPYSTKILFDTVLKQTQVAKRSLSFGAKYIYCLDKYYSIPNKPLNYFINNSYVSLYKNLPLISWINADTSTLPNSPQVFFTSSYINNYFEKNPIISGFLKGLEINSIYNWKPKAPITLFQGSADNLVYPIIADSAYKTILNNGGNIQPLDPANNINYLYPGVDHTSGFYIYLGYLWNKIF